jgi:hypothetical protein
MPVMIIILMLAFIGNSEAGEIWTKYDLPDSINCITSYGDNIWAGTNSGLIRLNRIDGSTKIFTTNDGLPSNTVTSVCADKSGIIYAGLRDNDPTEFNAYIISLDGEKVTDYSEISGLRNNIFYQTGYYTREIVSFIDIYNNNIYFAINIVLRGGNSSVYKIAVIQFDNLNWNIIYLKSVNWPFDKILIFNMFFSPYNLIYHYAFVTDNSQGKLKNILYDKNGEWDIYFSSRRADYIADSDTLKYTPENSGLTGFVNVMAIDKNYTKWFGCNFNTSLVRYDDVSWKVYKHDDWDRATIIKLLNIDEDNNVWVVTNNPSGLYRFNPNAITSVETANQNPATFTLSTAYPNPFNASTSISFTLNKPEKVSLAVYNLTGQKVRELASGNYSSGSHTTVWDGKDNSGNAVSSGVYLARMESGGVSKVVRMAMVK